MKNKTVFLGFLLSVLSCRTSHEFTLRETAAVSPKDAPFISVLVKKRIANLTGSTEATDGSTIKVDEVGPSKSFLVDFDEQTFTKIVKTICDKDANDLKIQNRTESLVQVAWGFKNLDIAKYSATIGIVDKSGYEISCSEETK